jgi:hypothetical protein
MENGCVAKEIPGWTWTDMLENFQALAWLRLRNSLSFRNLSKDAERGAVGSSRPQAGARE